MIVPMIVLKNVPLEKLVKSIIIEDRNKWNKKYLYNYFS